MAPPTLIGCNERCVYTQWCLTNHLHTLLQPFTVGYNDQKTCYLTVCATGSYQPLDQTGPYYEWKQVWSPSCVACPNPSTQVPTGAQFVKTDISSATIQWDRPSRGDDNYLYIDTTYPVSKHKYEPRYGWVASE